ncbi:MAG: succinate-semialdehyde dehydrogenase [Candidatus Nitrosocaldaceae archaeon]|nr:MAG: succinate-semialdehyde dehydrogenase [Candidatus Nitrosocaldaceae archaeon]
MKAAVLREIGKLTIEDIKEPKPNDDEVLIKVDSIGLCHTDLHVLKGHIPFPLPAVLGHEVSGVVEQVGKNVDNVQVGDKVVGPFILPCGKCRLCITGQEDLCEKFYNFNRLKGVYYDGNTRLFDANGNPIHMYSMAAHAEYSVIPSTSVFKIPDTLERDKSAILGCAIMTAYGACRNASLKPAETVAVFGTGGVGTNVVQIAAKVYNANVIAIDLNDEKLEHAKRIGAVHTINPKNEDAVKALLDYTDGRGVDVAIEVIGLKVTIDSAIKSVRSGGRVVLVGLAAKGNEASFEINSIVRRGVKIIGSYGGKPRIDMPEIISLADKGIINIKDAISAEYKLEEINEAFEKLEKGEILGRAIIKV